MAAVKKESTLALAGGPRAVTRQAPSWPVSGARELRWMNEVVQSGRWSWLGPHERAFCAAFSRFIGARYTIALTNGTVTMQCALQALGVQPGDEVIVPGLTWVATAQAAMDIGANVVFADIDPETLGLDPESFAAAITPRTRAVIPVHLYGCMCDMDAILDIARRHRIKVLEDVAHQHGSRWRDQGAGAIGDAGSFSFQQSKVLTCGEGGAVTTNDLDIYQTVFALKQVGWVPENPQENLYEPLIAARRYGHNYRMTEMQAVLLRGGFTRLTAQTARRERNAQRLREGLEAIGGPLRAARRDPRVTRQAYYAMTLYYDPEAADGVSRDAFRHALAAEGCSLGATYGPVYRNPLLNLDDATSPLPYRDPATLQDYRQLSLPNTERSVQETAATLSQVHLLGDSAYVRQLLAAIRKVTDQLPRVRQAWEERRS